MGDMKRSVEQDAWLRVRRDKKCSDVERYDWLPDKMSELFRREDAHALRDTALPIDLIDPPRLTLTREVEED